MINNELKKIQLKKENTYHSQDPPQLTAKVSQNRYFILFHKLQIDINMKEFSGFQF